MLERPDIKIRNRRKAVTVNQYICEKLKNQNDIYANERLNQELVKSRDLKLP